MPLANQSGGVKFVKGLNTEEKRTYVNFAVHLLNDAWLDLYDCGVVVNCDSDISVHGSCQKASLKEARLRDSRQSSPFSTFGEAC